MELLVKPLNQEVKAFYENHSHYHEGDAGLDLFIVNEQTIEPGETTFVHLQISCETVDGKPYLLMPRSSISKTPLRLSNSIGLIDGGYRGEIIAAVDNIKDQPYILEPGQRLFQLVGMDGSPVKFKMVDNLSATARGDGGFGSTGK